MTIDIQKHLSRAEEDFVNCFNDGPSLEGFRTSWVNLVDSLSAGPPLDTDTSCLAHAVAHRVGALASDILQIHNDSAAIGTSLLAEVDSILESLTIHDFEPPKINPSLPLNPGCPPYIGPAYKWLIKHIHNPYPSKDVKMRISQTTGTSLQNIDAWFLNTRRRIGWTALSKRYFSGSRPDTVEAAYRALIQDDSALGDKEGEPLSANIRMAFVQMEATAKELYSNRFTQSMLAGKLDGMVKDMTDIDGRRRGDLRATAKEERRRKHETEKSELNLKAAGKKWKDANASESSLTPPRLPSPTSTMSADSQETLVYITRKKRGLSEGGSELEAESYSNRPLKRSRRVLSAASSYSSSEEYFASGSSRASSCALTLSDDEPQTPPFTTRDDNVTLFQDGVPMMFPSVRQAQCPTRKRRLSGVDGEPSPKSQTLVCPRLQVASDPFPNLAHNHAFHSPSSSTPSSTAASPLFEVLSVPPSEWSSLFFDTPGAAVLDELDLSVLRESEFSCIAETAALLNGGNAELDQLLTKDCTGIGPSVTHSNSLGISPDESDSPLGWSYPAWPYRDIAQMSTPCKFKSDARSDDSREPLASLGGFSSLSSLPMNQFELSSVPTSDAISSILLEATLPVNDIEHIDWLSIIPQPFLSDGFAPNTTSIEAMNEASHTRMAYDGVNMPARLVADSTLPLSTSTAPLTITLEARAEKYKQYRELMNKAKQLEAELGQSGPVSEPVSS